MLQPLAQAQTYTNAQAAARITSDPVFISALRTQLTLPENVHSQWLADALAHRIARAPKDLRGHVQRIILHQMHNEGDALFAALLDLFIALGAFGLALRKRLLQSSSALLSTTQRDFLNAHIDTGVSAREPHPSAPRSRLSQGCIGSLAFITRSTSGKSRDARSPLEQALDFLNYGQVDQAQKTLEEALIENPDDAEIARELVGLYAHSKDANAIASLATRLGAQTPPIIRNLANDLTSSGAK